MERAAAEARASSILEGSPGNCIIPAGFSSSGSGAGSIPLGNQPVRRSCLSQKALAVTDDDAAATSHSPGSSKPPLAGRRFSRHNTDLTFRASSCNAAHTTVNSSLSGSPPGALIGGLQGRSSPQDAISGVCGVVQGADDDEEADLDRQLAALAALRRAKQASRSAAVMASISGKTLVDVAEGVGVSRAGGRLEPQKATGFDLAKRPKAPAKESSCGGPPGSDWQQRVMSGQCSSDTIQAIGPCLTARLYRPVILGYCSCTTGLSPDDC